MVEPRLKPPGPGRRSSCRLAAAGPPRFEAPAQIGNEPLPRRPDPLVAKADHMDRQEDPVAGDGSQPLEPAGGYQPFHLVHRHVAPAKARKEVVQPRPEIGEAPDPAGIDAAAL